MTVPPLTPFGSWNWQEVTKVFIGASAMMSNGAVLSRVGTVSLSVRRVRSDLVVLCAKLRLQDPSLLHLTCFFPPHHAFPVSIGSSDNVQAVVAMMARSHNLPIMFCCETYKVRLGIHVV